MYYSFLFYLKCFSMLSKYGKKIEQNAERNIGMFIYEFYEYVLWMDVFNL